MGNRSAVLELAVLGLLHEQPMHGYELRKRLNAQSSAPFRALSYGSLYPCLKAMQTARADRDRRQAPADRPGRPAAKIVYGSPRTARSTCRSCSTEAGPAAWEDETFGVHSRLLRADRPGGAAADPGRPPSPAGGAPGRASGPRWPGPGNGSTATRSTAGARPGVGRARGPLAERTDRHRTPPDQQPPHRISTTRRSTKETPMSSVRVAIVGVGNCAASLVQGVEYYRDADAGTRGARPDARAVRRLPRPRHRVRRRVRRRRQEGRRATCPRRSAPARTTPSSSPTCRRRRHRAARPHPRRPGQVLPPDDQGVRRGAGRRRRRAARGPGRRAGLLPAGRLGGRGQVLRPVRDRREGRASSTRCRCSSPAPRSGPRSSPTAGVPIVGDDIKSQVGATITHRVLAKLFEDRGVILDRTMQLNVGGNMDFMNMLERERLESKKISKTQSVTSQLSTTTWARATSTSARPTTWPGWTTASGPTSGSRAARSATCR